MATYVVTYDLHQTGQNYTCLIGKLKSYSTHWHAQGSVWLIQTTDSAVQVRDKLAACLDSNDKLIVARLQGEAAWIGYGADINRWLKATLEA